jgi:hypothetical protein
MDSDHRLDDSKHVEYQVFGLRLISDYPFTSRLYISTTELNSAITPPALFFTCNQFFPPYLSSEERNLIFSSPIPTSDHESQDKLYRFNDYDVFEFSAGVDFYLSPGRIYCHLRNPVSRFLVELLLLGTVLAYCLERDGIPVLHASAVEIDGRLAVFPSPSGNGKSTLAAAFLQKGAALLTDDIFPLEYESGGFWGRPGLPQINLWPAQGANLMDEFSEFEAVSPYESKKRIPVEAIKNGTFCRAKRPLACIYIPSKFDGLSTRPNIEITPLPPAEALIELVRYSYFPPAFAQEMGWQAQRLDFFARLVNQIPVRRLRYPVGFEHLPRVTEAVLQDLKNLPSQP